MSVSNVTVSMTTTGYVALECYLKWKTGRITSQEFQGALNSLGYQLTITQNNPDWRKDEESLVRNILTEFE